MKHYALAAVICMIGYGSAYGLPGCSMYVPVSDTLHRYAFQHPQMGTVFRLVFYARTDSAEAGRLAASVFERIDTLNAIFSDWLPDSELNRLCRTAGSGQAVQVSPELFDILEKAIGYARKSGGAFDVTIGPLTRLWRRARTLKEFPEKRRIDEARKHTGWKQIKLQPQTRGLLLTKAGTGLDLGGIAQGWTADHCLGMLRLAGIDRALVDAGGDIALGAPPPGKSAWQIEFPAGVDTTGLGPLRQCGVTTSGATYRYMEFDGVRYSHIINPQTGMPLTHRILVTVKANDATTADAWATGLSVLGKKGIRKAQRSGDRIAVRLSRMPL